MRDKLDSGELMLLLDIVWADNRSFYKAGQWLLKGLLTPYPSPGVR